MTYAEITYAENLNAKVRNRNLDEIVGRSGEIIINDSGDY